MGNRKTQKIIFYDTRGDVETKRIVVPKIINTDIGFQLMFGMEPPGRITQKYQQFKKEVYMDEIKTNR
jgi:hypothetical protein